MEYNIGSTEVQEKIVIGKTWFYVALLFIGVLLIYMYRCHHIPPDPKSYVEPEFDDN